MDVRLALRASTGASNAVSPIDNHSQFHVVISSYESKP
jgi:hypothetical protein